MHQRSSCLRLHDCVKGKNLAVLDLLTQTLQCTANISEHPQNTISETFNSERLTGKIHMGYFNNEGFRNNSIKNMGHFLFAASVFFEHKFTIALTELF